MNDYKLFYNINRYFEDEKRFSKSSLDKYNYGFIFSMLIDLSKEETSRDKAQCTKDFVQEVYDKINGEDFEVYEKETDKVLYKSYLGYMKDLNINQLIIKSDVNFTHLVDILILGNIEEILNPEFKISLIKNRLIEVIEQLDKHDSMLGCNRMAMSCHDISNSSKFITMDFNTTEIR